jgi:hypothetical protein
MGCYTIIFHLIGCIIIGGVGGGWSRGVPKRRRDFGVGVVILPHVLFFLRVTEDDNVVITRRP